MQSHKSIKSEISKMKDDKEINVMHLAEHAERFQDMVNALRNIIKDRKVLNSDERNYLTIAYKSYVASGRNAWRVMSALEFKEQDNPDKVYIGTLKKYKLKIQTEVQSICTEVIAMLENDLIHNADENDAKVFYIKMKGDYYRYKCECSPKEKRKMYTESALQHYVEASEIAEKHLSKTSSLRLSLILNFSVFYYEVMNLPRKAYEIAKKGFDEAICDMTGIETEFEHNDKANKGSDTLSLLAIIKENLTIWNADLEEGVEKADY